MSVLLRLIGHYLVLSLKSGTGSASTVSKTPTLVSQTPHHPPESLESLPAYGSAATAPPHVAGLHWTCLYL